MRNTQERPRGRSHGEDISKYATQFARSRFKGRPEFTIQFTIDLRDFPNGLFDVTITSEVLEHLKEYGAENEAVKELKRVRREGGLLVIATPNSEMLPDHGFSLMR